jgi:hypothetical protein
MQYTPQLTDNKGTNGCEMAAGPQFLGQKLIRPSQSSNNRLFWASPDKVVNAPVDFGTA